MSKLKIVSVIFALVVLICCVSTVSAAEVDDGYSISQTDIQDISESSHARAAPLNPVLCSGDNIGVMTDILESKYDNPFDRDRPEVPAGGKRPDPFWIGLYQISDL